MTDHSSSDDQGATRPEVAKIDFAKYRTSDLVGRMVELISVPKAFVKVLQVAGFVLLIAILACYLIRLSSEITLLPWLCVCAYSLVLSVGLGIALGLLRVIVTALRNIESILRLILEMTGNVATDYDQLQSGEMRMPSGGELVEQVNESIVLPAMEQAVAGAFGFFGRPLAWLFRRTIGSAARFVNKQVNRKFENADDERAIGEETKVAFGGVSRYSDKITAYTSSAADVVESVGRRIRFFAMLPMYLLFTATLAIAMVPIALVLYFAG